MDKSTTQISQVKFWYDQKRLGVRNAQNKNGNEEVKNMQAVYWAMNEQSDFVISEKILRYCFGGVLQNSNIILYYILVALQWYISTEVFLYFLF